MATKPTILGSINVNLDDAEIIGQNVLAVKTAAEGAGGEKHKVMVLVVDLEQDFGVPEGKTLALVAKTDGGFTKVFGTSTNLDVGRK